jgi:hypothetical protein
MKFCKLVKYRADKSKRISISKLRLKNKKNIEIKEIVEENHVIDLTYDDNNDNIISTNKNNDKIFWIKEEEEDSSINFDFNDDCDEDINKHSDLNSDYINNNISSEDEYQYSSDEDISEENIVHGNNNIKQNNDIDSQYVTLSQTNIEIEILKYVTILERYGLKSHFTSAVGGKIAIKRINSISRRLAGCVHWIYNLCDPPVDRLRGNHSQFNEETFMRYVKCFILREYVLLSSYINYCEKNFNLKSSTAKGIVSNIYAGIKWFILFKNTSEYRINQFRIYGIDETVKGLRKCLSKDMKKNRVDATLSKVTYDLKLPEGSSSLEQLQILQKHLQDQIPMVNRILSVFLKENILSRTDYILFMRILYSSLYVFTAQGRVGGVESLLYKDGVKLLSDNYALTDKFKTQATFGKQPIILGVVSKDIFSLYYNNLRPFIVSKNYIEENLSDAPMWLTYHGKEQKHIGLQMSNYFIQALNLNITTNGLRSLVETLCDGLHR